MQLFSARRDLLDGHILNPKCATEFEPKNRESLKSLNKRSPVNSKENMVFGPYSSCKYIFEYFQSDNNVILELLHCFLGFVFKILEPYPH